MPNAPVPAAPSGHAAARALLMAAVRLPPLDPRAFRIFGNVDEATKEALDSRVVATKRTQPVCKRRPFTSSAIDLTS